MGGRGHGCAGIPAHGRAPTGRAFLLPHAQLGPIHDREAGT